MTALFEIAKHVRRANEIWRASDAGGGRVRKHDHRETALGRNSLPVKDLRHDGTAEHLVESRESRRVAVSVVTRRQRLIGFLRAGTQYRRARATTRDVEDQVVAFDVAIPNAAAVARSLALPAAMLNLEITRRHVRVRLDRLGRILLAAFEIVFADDLE